MNSLDYLSSLLRSGTEEGSTEMRVSSSIDDVLRQMQERSKGHGVRFLSMEHQLEAVRNFWRTQEVASFRDAYLLSWGLCLPHQPEGPCVMEDQRLLGTLLEGVDSWSFKPSAFRRCYQGLIKSYFTFELHESAFPKAAQGNCEMLRKYLHAKNGAICDESVNPDWASTAIANRQLFEQNPCEPYVDALLRGDVSVIEHMCEALGIDEGSWFLRDLVLAQVEGATKLSNGDFENLLPRLLELLAKNNVLRDRGLVMLLDRYAGVPGAPLHPGLRDAAVLGWGNPWLPSNKTCWGGVVPEARAMVSEWLKLELIEAFFTKLAEDGMGDPRRMEFWKRYVKAIGPIKFALGSTARNAQDRDFIALRKKMKGLICKLDASGTNNAFIMTMGDLVAVEFSSLGNALYGYDSGASSPFDTSKDLRLASNAVNSLKQQSKSILWLKHSDGRYSWDKWEDTFEARLRNDFNIEPNSPLSKSSQPRTPAPVTSLGDTQSQSRKKAFAWGTAPDLSRPFTRTAFDKWASRQGLLTEDKTLQGGSLWVRTDASDEEISETLTFWGFQYRSGKGWWK